MEPPSDPRGTALPASTVRLLLVCILALAAALRLVALGTIPGFGGDEGLDLFYARQLVEHGAVRLHPVRPYFGPYQLWLMAPFLELLGFTPLAARIVPAVAGVGATWLAWRFGRSWGGEAQGLAAAALLGLAPWFVGYSRVGLSVAHMPALTVLCWALLVKLADRRTAAIALGFGASVGAAVVFHPTGLLLGPAVVLGLAAHPGGRDLIRRPALVGCAMLGFAATGWIAWDLILAQVGLGPGVDLSLTHVDEAAAVGLGRRLVTTTAVILDTAAGGRALEWLSGVPSDEQWLLRPLRWAVAAGLVLAAVRAGRERDPVGLGLVAAIGATTLLAAVRAASFDLQVLSRERYVLVPVTLIFLLLPRGLVWQGSSRRLKLGAAAVVAWCLLSVAGTEAGFLRPMRTVAASSSASMIVARPDAKLQAAELILQRMQPGEEGLLLAGDGWSYWSIVCFLGERMPADFVPEDPAECAAVLRRTRHRRRFLVDYAGGEWLDEIGACLDGAGYGGDLEPVFAPTAADGEPILLLWELAPEEGTPADR